MIICNLIILYVFFSYLGQLNNICDFSSGCGGKENGANLSLFKNNIYSFSGYHQKKNIIHRVILNKQMIAFF